MPTNRAAWIKEKKGKPLVVDEAPYTSPGADEVTIKNGAVSINPVDWKIQDVGFFIEKFPNILGEDVAGEIVEVGDGVTDLKVGQRVFGYVVIASISYFVWLTNIKIVTVPPSWTARSPMPVSSSTPMFLVHSFAQSQTP